MVVSGTVNGSIKGDQEIVIGIGGNIRGKLEGDTISVAGIVEGDLMAHKRLEIISSAKIKGELRVLSGQLLIQEGAELEADCLTHFKKITHK